MFVRKTKGKGATRPLTRTDPYAENIGKDRKSGNKKKMTSCFPNVFSVPQSYRTGFFISELFGTRPMGTTFPGDFKNAAKVASIFTFSRALEKVAQTGR